MARKPAHLSDLKARLKEAYERAHRADPPMNFETIGAELKVSASNVRKYVFLGKFQTINPTIRQICQILKVDPDNPERLVDASAADAARIQARALALWDKTSHEDAERVIRLLIQLAAYRGLPPTGAAPADQSA